MKRFRVIGILILLGLVASALPANAFIAEGDLVLSPKGWGATVIRLEGVNTSHALAVGEVRRSNAVEYCERTLTGRTTPDGKSYPMEPCIKDVLREEKGKLYSISADCPRKTILTEFGSFTLLGIYAGKSFSDMQWRNNDTGQVLDGSGASGAPVVDSEFKLLCPAFVKGRLRSE